MARLLLVEDDRVLRDTVAAHLERAGHRVAVCDNGDDGLIQCRTDPPEVLLLDLMLPGLSGRDVLQQVRATHPDLPVILVTARGQEHERIQGLQWGADDYVTKPFSLRELELRVRALLRRAPAAATPPAVLRDGDLELDPAARSVRRAGTDLGLTGREFDLLAFLLRHAGTTHSRADLMREVWGWEVGDDSTVTVHVRRLREKVEQDPSRPTRLVTVFGHGYRWDSRDGAAADGA